MSSTDLEYFLSYMSKNKKFFWPSIAKNQQCNRELFEELGSLMIGWAVKYLGSDYRKVLADGYVSFVTEVNKSQVKYEARGYYLNKSYEDVFRSVYNNSSHMNLYHWGVYTTTFAWEHHLKLYRFFRDFFLPLLNPEEGVLLDLGAGSGIWSLLFLHNLQNWKCDGIDISQTSVALANNMAEKNGFPRRVQYKVQDALLYSAEYKYDSCISCFLLEHLENPILLIKNIAKNIAVGGYAFITGALTAAEIDHITEFKYESELVKMAEESGFRVVATYSAAPKSYPAESHYLPRSMALILQKKRNDLW